MSRKTILPNIAYDTQRRSFYVTIRRSMPDGTTKRAVQCYPTLELAIQALDRRGGEEILTHGEGLDKRAPDPHGSTSSRRFPPAAGLSTPPSLRPAPWMYRPEFQKASPSSRNHKNDG